MIKLNESEKLFKIDLIVWKHDSNKAYSENLNEFKIDLIVWKLDKDNNVKTFLNV